MGRVRSHLGHAGKLTGHTGKLTHLAATPPQRETPSAAILTDDRKTSKPHLGQEITAAMISMKGKVAVVFGLANKRSIAYSIAQKLAEAGATLVLGYQSERLQREAEQLLEDLGQTGVGRAFPCDVSHDDQIEAVFAQIKESFGRIDTLVHSVAFAPADEIKNDFLLTSREGFRIAHDVSVYSLIALARGAAHHS